MPGWPVRLHLNNDWLDERFKLFEETCLPSVAAQTNHNFDWFVFFDSKTIEKYRKKIDALVKIYNFNPIYLNVFDLKSIQALIADRFANKGYKRLLTSRLDSDDVLATHYIEVLQSKALQTVEEGKPDRLVFNFDCGAVLSYKNGKKDLYMHEDISNPFASLLEPFSPDFTTVLWEDHSRLLNVAEVVHIREQFMWLQMVHGRNISNRARGKRIAIDSCNHNFPYMRLVSKGVQESRFSLLLDNYILGTYRKLRDNLITFVKRYYQVNKHY